MNQYGSNLRALTARNVLEASISPATPVSISKTDFVKQIFDAGYRSQPNVIWNDKANLFIHRVGLFCNFADGLVWGTPEERAQLRISAAVYQNGAGLSGTSITTDLNTKKLTGVGTLFQTDPVPGKRLVAGDIINQGTQPYIIAKVNSDTDADLTDYGRGVTTAASGVIHLYPDYINAIQTTLYGLSVLNYFMDWDVSLPVGALAATYLTKYDGILLFAEPIIKQSISLLTNSIDTSYNNASLFMDVVAEYEISAY